jgi:hypothetical protein
VEDDRLTAGAKALAALHHRTLHAAQARFWAWGPALPLALVLVLAGCGPLLLAWVLR